MTTCVYERFNVSIAAIHVGELESGRVPAETTAALLRIRIFGFFMLYNSIYNNIYGNTCRYPLVLSSVRQ